MHTFFSDTCQVMPIQTLINISIALYFHIQHADLVKPISQFDNDLQNELVYNWQPFYNKVQRIAEHLYSNNVFPRLTAKINRQRYQKQTCPIHETITYCLLMCRKEIGKLYRY